MPCFLALLICALLHGADDRADDGSGYSLTVFQAVGLDTTLPGLVPNLFSGDLETKPDWFTALAVKGAIIDRVQLGWSWTDCWMGPLEWEVQGVRHYGTEDYWESTAALILRTRDLVMGDLLAVNVAVGDGMSYAFTDNANEKGSSQVYGEDTYQLLNYLVLEAEWSAPSWRHLSVATRIHHRCGVWGVVAPAYSGSNYLSVGLRYGF